MLVIVRDDVARYWIECPRTCRAKVGHRGHDYLVVPDPVRPDVPYWLFDGILIEAARSGDFGLRLLREERLAGRGGSSPPLPPG